MKSRLLALLVLCLPSLLPAGPVPTPDAPDRRPIAVVTQADNSKRRDDNPRGWNDLFYADAEAAHDLCLKNAIDLGAQAGLFWDYDGQEHDHPTSYGGTPWMLPPDRSIEQLQRWSQKWLSAGLRVGGLIRPQLYRRGPPARQDRVDDYFGVLAAKVGYARADFGWTVFYVDTNTTGMSGDARFIPADVFRRLAEAFPDCLFIPEFAGVGYDKLPVNVRPLLYPDPRAYHGKPTFPRVVLKPENTKPSAKRLVEFERQCRDGGIPLVAAGWKLSPENVWTGRCYRASLAPARD